jgi:hypothetical protein
VGEHAHPVLVNLEVQDDQARTLGERQRARVGGEAAVRADRDTGVVRHVEARRLGVLSWAAGQQNRPAVEGKRVG